MVCDSLFLWGSGLQVDIVDGETQVAGVVPAQREGLEAACFEV